MRFSGFTLVEILIYLLIFIFILVLATTFFWQILSLSIKENSYQEVQQNGSFAIMRLGQEIKKAESIISPSPGSTSSSLFLEMAEESLNPTVFDLFEGKLRITQGTSTPVFLTTDRVIVSNLIFTNLSYPGTPGTLRVEMEVEHSNPIGKIEYEASISLKSTFSLLKGRASP